MCKALGLIISSTTKRKPERYFWWNLGGYLIASREKVKSNSEPASTAPDSLSLCEMRMSWSHSCLGAAGILASWGENTEPRFSVTYCTGGIFASLEWGVGKLRERKLSTLQHISSFERRIIFIEGVLCWILVSQSSSLWVMQCWSWGLPKCQLRLPGWRRKKDVCWPVPLSRLLSDLQVISFHTSSGFQWAVFPEFTHFIMLLASGIIKSQDLFLLALGSGPQDSLFQPRGNSSS